MLSASPLATQEAVAVTGMPVWGLPHLADPVAAAALHEALLAERRPAWGSSAGLRTAAVDGAQDAIGVGAGRPERSPG